MVHEEHRKIGRRAGVVGLFTFLSRVFGLVRDSVIAYFFGASNVADAFYVAFRIPNLFRRLTAEGALTIAFVPIFTDYLKASREDAKKAASVVFTYLSLALAALVVAGVIFAPQMVKMIAYGFAANPEKFNLTVYLTRLIFPYIFLISLTALSMGILNSLKHFAMPAASPVLLNIFIIIGAAVFSRWFTEPAAGLALGVIIGGISQIALQVPVMIRLGMLPRINFDRSHPALRRLLFLMLPAAFGAAVYQVNVLIVTFLASFLPAGSVSYLWYADRVTEFPQGIFAIAIATATLPTLSDHAAERDMELFKRTLRFSLKSAFLVEIPAAVGLFILSVPVIKVLFERGEFTHANTMSTASALSFFVLGMPFVGAVRNIVPAFFAMKDSKTPVLTAVGAVVVNAVFAALLMRPLLHMGLAFALAISNMANFALLVFALRRKIGELGGRGIFLSAVRASIASAVMGAAVWLFANYAVREYFARGTMMLVLAVFLSIIVGIAAFAAALRLIRAPEFRMIAEIARRGNKKLRELPQ